MGYNPFDSRFSNLFSMRIAMGTDEILKSKRGEILALATQRGIKNLRVFGSVARGQAGPDSDVDFLVDVELGRTYLDMGAFLMDLQDLLGRKVDLVTERALYAPIKCQIFNEAVPSVRGGLFLMWDAYKAYTISGLQNRYKSGIFFVRRVIGLMCIIFLLARDIRC
jgi:predicted nucleotidyltransferase